MLNKRIEKIIANYFDGEISKEETQELVKWVEDGNLDIFNEYVSLNFSIEQSRIITDAARAKSWERIMSHLNGAPSKKVLPLYRKPIFRYAVAASVALLVGLTIFVDPFGFRSSDTTIVNNNIQTGGNKATLTLEDGSVVALNEGEIFQNQNANSNGNALVYTAQKDPKEALTYNYLTIPRGGQYTLNLSDGTKVWLNSETQLKYPVDFIAGQTRTVELVYGEAYFEVSPSTKHKGARFVVLNDAQKIEVLGTEFNVKAYSNESSITTTLVHGRISIDYLTHQQILNPDQQAVVDKNTKTLTVNTVDVFHDISWKDGIFSFDNKSLKNIMVVLSRWYDFEVEFRSKTIENELFIGSLGKNDKIEDILSNLRELGVINNFKIDDKTITIE